MSYSHYFLKLFCLFFVLLSNTQSNAIESYDNSNIDSKVEHKKPNATIFFINYLANKNTTCDSIFPLTLDQIKQEQQAVWEAWKIANNSLSEQKLPQLTALSSGQSSSWNLPAELEPNAIMPFSQYVTPAPD